MSRVVDITGTKALYLMLNRFPKTMRNKVLRKALNRAATPIVKMTRKNAKKVSKNPLTPDYKRKEGKHLYQSVGKRAKTYGKQGTVFVAAGFLFKEGGYHAHLVESGHRLPGGGMTRARPMLKPAWEQTKRQSLQTLVSVGMKSTVTEAVKLAKKTGMKKLGLK